MKPVFTALAVEIDAPLASVALNRPDKANAMNAALWQELEDCFRWLDSEPSVRVVILTGLGKHFCSGLDLEMFADIAQLQAPDAARRNELLRRKILAMQANLSAIEQCRKPVLAAVHGACIGGGMDMILCCDLRYASADARFCVKETAIGMTADVGTLQRLPAVVGQGIAAELALTADTVDAAEAQRIGLVNRVYANREQLQDGARAIALKIAAHSPLAVRGTKQMLLYARDHSVADGLNHVATWNAGLLSSEDVTEAMTAQLEGRPPRFEE
ncbi:MAG TPA: crotonase/enoyl-CoA hydratase family protein [Spongiibacteraceae bacterium]|nr:crotonase/enoyl-CoA hydratase family protein [Spongiibacteraceae bacterium]